MSSKANTPTNFNGETDHFYDPSFTAEISQKMRVPKVISVDGVCDTPNVTKSDYNAWMPAEKLDMQVPEKIVVAGNDEIYGTRSIPREIVLDNTIMPPDPGNIRVQTPPRVITIDSMYGEEGSPSHPPPMSFSAEPLTSALRPKPEVERRFDMSLVSTGLNDSISVPPEGMTLNEEVVHLRRQLAKLNRRIMSIELENMQRQHRDKIIYALGLAYFFFKTVIWLSRSS